MTMIEIERFLLMERDLNRRTCQPLLKLCAELAEVDRITVFQYYPNESVSQALSVIAEWCAEGMEMQTQWQNLNLQIEQYQTVLERARQILNTGEILMCHVKELTIAEQMLSSSGGVQALLLIPISVKNRFYGIAALQRVRSSALWDEEIQNFLKSIAVAVSIALERKYAEQDLVEAKEQ
ncbi:MAG: GAF domain-containing protein, partial [Candidatus Thermochlorobacter sp.]